MKIAPVGIGLLLLVVCASLVSAEVLPPPSCPDCQLVANRYGILLQELNQSNDRLTQDLQKVIADRDHYKNLSEYYQYLYETKNITITNREVIFLNQKVDILNQNISNLNIQVNELEKKITLFSIEVGVSVVSISVLGATLIEVVMRWRRRRNNGRQ